MLNGGEIAKYRLFLSAIPRKIVIFFWDNSFTDFCLKNDWMEYLLCHVAEHCNCSAMSHLQWYSNGKQELERLNYNTLKNIVFCFISWRKETPLIYAPLTFALTTAIFFFQIYWVCFLTFSPLSGTGLSKVILLSAQPDRVRVHL